MLLESGADPNIPDELGYTPLMAAIHNGCTTSVELLAEHSKTDLKVQVHYMSMLRV